MATDTLPTVHVGMLLDNLSNGGVQGLTIQLANELANHGCRVDLVVCKPDGELTARIRAGVRVVSLAKTGKAGGLLKLLKSNAKQPGVLLWLLSGRAGVLRRWARYMPALAAYMRANPQAVILAPKDKLGFMAIWAKQLAGWNGRIVIGQHGHFSACKGVTIRADRWETYAKLMRLQYRFANDWFAVSEAAAKDLESIARVPVKTIYNPMPSLPDVVVAPEHPWAHPPVGTRLVVSAGRLDQSKDFATLLRAFAIAVQMYDLRLVILGEGEDRDRLEKLVQSLGLDDRVQMPGYSDNVTGWMSCADLFVLSSRVEGFGLVILEALACGCPVVSTDCPSGPAEILADGAYGRLVPVGDHEALAGAMCATLDDPPDGDVLKRRASEFSLDATLDRYLHVLSGARETA